MTFVQGNKASPAGFGTTIPLAFLSGNAAGNALVVLATSGDATPGFSISDSQGNVWTQVGTTLVDAGNAQAVAMWVAANCKAGPNTVTVACANAQFRGIIIAEYSGVATSSPADGTAGQVAAGTTAANNVTSGNLTTTTDGDLIVGGVMPTSASPAITAGTGFTARETATVGLQLQDKTLATHGAVASTWTFSAASEYAAIAVALKPASAATVPGAPTIGTATAGDAQASVAFTPPTSDGGATITGYTATSSPGGITASGAASPLTVTGLVNGTAYTFTVHAHNSVGNSAESAASNAVTPTVPNSPPIADAGPDQAVAVGATVTLDGTGSSDPDADTITYAWTQTAGAAVVLSDATSPTPTFTAPASADTLVFALTVDDGTAASDPSTVTITVTAPAVLLRAGGAWVPGQELLRAGGAWVVL